jgi:hypothetical protein
VLEAVDLLGSVVFEDFEIPGRQVLDRHAVLCRIRIDPHQVGLRAEPRRRRRRLLLLGRLRRGGARRRRPGGLGDQDDADETDTRKLEQWRTSRRRCGQASAWN